MQTVNSTYSEINTDTDIVSNTDIDSNTDSNSNTDSDSDTDIDINTYIKQSLVTTATLSLWQGPKTTHRSVANLRMKLVSVPTYIPIGGAQNVVRLRGFK